MNNTIKIISVAIMDILFVNCIAQLSENEYHIVKFGRDYKMIFKGQEFDVHDSILTVKPKTENISNLNLNVIRKNILGFMDIKIPPYSNVEDYRKELLKTGMFESVDFNTYGEYLTYSPDDEFLDQQWYLSAINMFDAWDFTKGDPSIIVAVIDNGVNWEHDDLGTGENNYQNIFLNPGEAWLNENDPNSGNDADDDNNGFPDDWKGWNFTGPSNDTRPAEGYSHGTHVAGIIAAKTNNDYGIAGIAGGNLRQGVLIMHVLIGYVIPQPELLDDAILYAVQNGAKVINISSSGGAESYQTNQAISYAWDHNCVIVCASGNGNLPVVSYPASSAFVLAVGALDNNKIRWNIPYSFGSNYGNELDMVAPGTDIYSLGYYENYYPLATGTSTSAPMVSSVAALILSINNSLEVSDVMDILESSAQKIDTYVFSYDPDRYYTWHEEVGYGLLDAHEALQAAVCYLPIENTIYSSDVNLSGCSSGIELINVVVQNNSTLTIDKSHGVDIYETFEVQLGSVLQIQ